MRVNGAETACSKKFFMQFFALLYRRAYYKSDNIGGMPLF